MQFLASNLIFFFWKGGGVKTSNLNSLHRFLNLHVLKIPIRIFVVLWGINIWTKFFNTAIWLAFDTVGICNRENLQVWRNVAKVNLTIGEQTLSLQGRSPMTNNMTDSSATGNSQPILLLSQYTRVITWILIITLQIER